MKVGDVVVIQGHTTKMTIEEIYPSIFPSGGTHTYKCTWFDKNGHLWTNNFISSQIMLDLEYEKREYPEYSREELK